MTKDAQRCDVATSDAAHETQLPAAHHPRIKVNFPDRKAVIALDISDSEYALMILCFSAILSLEVLG
jgi:hypothetical protein